MPTCLCTYIHPIRDGQDLKAVGDNETRVRSAAAWARSQMRQLSYCVRAGWCPRLVRTKRVPECVESETGARGENNTTEGGQISGRVYTCIYTCTYIHTRSIQGRRQTTCSDLTQGADVEAPMYCTKAPSLQIPSL
jgi:hypothetical protein